MRADRLISTLLLLQVHGRLTSRDLAERLEISERTVLRDMDALSAAGVPVVADRGAGGGWRLVDGYQTKLTGLTAAEIQTLFFAHPPQLLDSLGLGPAAEAAWLKLQAALPAASQRQAERARRSILIDPRGWQEPQSMASLPVLLDALWRGRRVRFVYERALGEAAERLADPLGLVARGSVWYLVASRDDQLRTYRVSRIREAMLDDQGSATPDNFELAAYWETSTVEFRERLPRYYATFLVAPSVMRWARYRGWRLEEEHEEGNRVRIHVRFDAEEEAVQFALSFGADAELIEPVALRNRVLEAARGTVEQYASLEQPLRSEPPLFVNGNPLLGTWKMKSYAVTTAAGVRSTPYGNNPTGYLSYSADGRMQVIGAAYGRILPAGPDPPDNERAALHDTMFAYGGSYSVEAGKVIHHVDISWNEVWTGTDQIRLFEVNGNTLTLTTRAADPASETEVHYAVVWEKVAGL